MRTRSTVGLAFLACVLLGSLGTAQAGTIALIPIEAPGVEAAGRVVDGGLRSGVQRTPVLTEKGPVQMSLEEARTSFSCFEESPDCMSQVGGLIGAESMVWGRLSRAGGHWRIQLKLLDVKESSIVREASADVPDGPAAMERLAQVADAFVRGQEVPVISLVSVDVESIPTGADAAVDGRGIGQTPTRVDLEPGRYALEVRAADGRSARREFQVDHAPVQLTVELPEVPAEEGVSSGLVWGITTGVIALGGVGMATYFGAETLQLQADADTTINPSPEYTQIEDDFNQARVLSNIGWGVAAVAGAASLYFLVWHDEGGDVAIAPGPAGLTVLGGF